jgi:hypothetical protein
MTKNRRRTKQGTCCQSRERVTVVWQPRIYGRYRLVRTTLNFLHYSNLNFDRTSSESHDHETLSARECRTPDVLAHDEIPTAKHVTNLIGLNNGVSSSPERVEVVDDGNSESTSSSLRKLHHALSSAGDSSTTIVAAATTLASSTLEATREGTSTSYSGGHFILVLVQLLTNDAIVQ